VSQLQSPAEPGSQFTLVDHHTDDGHANDDMHAAADEGSDHGKYLPKIEALHGDYYLLGKFGKLRLTISYYIDTLTLCMFCMVTLISTLIHFYAQGYMHEEIDDELTDHEVQLEDGSDLKRAGRYHRFFQFLSLFCFSMLGLVLAGNLAMVFVFWELVGICSYFLIGFYVERRSACNAANKAFIVNRVGDFGMIIGLMIFWTGFGTLAFGDYREEIATIVARSTTGEYELTTTTAHGLLTGDRIHLSQIQVTDDGAMPGQLNGGTFVVTVLSTTSLYLGDTKHDGTYDTSNKGTWSTQQGLFSMARPAGVMKGNTLHLHKNWKVVDETNQISFHEKFRKEEAADKELLRMQDLHPESQLKLESSVRKQLTTPDGLVRLSAREELQKAVWQERIRLLTIDKEKDLTPEAREELIATEVKKLRNDDPEDDSRPRYGYWLLIIGGLGIFCGCVGKSAQFPLHVWLPDAMEGPTPVSALVHSATMVAAGVYLVARFFPLFAAEVLLVIAVIGVITLFLAATIAITATDIKRVLAYSTISQLGYMMMALGLGAWVAGVFHLITHAFFKSLLFMCSGSVIHAVHTNEMTEMGGLRHKMPWTAYTMLIGCLAISGAGIPFLIGFSGYYSKDAILEQAFSFWQSNSVNGVSGAGIFFWLAVAGAAITAFYMFRLWYMTFAGQPRDEHRYEHAHESPRVMYVPLVILAFFATTIAWKTPDFFGLGNFHLTGLLETARPDGLRDVMDGLITSLSWPDEHASHAWAIRLPVTLLAFSTAMLGIILATVFYLFRWLSADEVRDSVPKTHRFLVNKWYFDELYDVVFVKPAHLAGSVVAFIDRHVLDGLVHLAAFVTRTVSVFWDRVTDQLIVDGSVNLLAAWTHRVGLALRNIQTGRIRQYVMFIVVGAVALFLVISFFFNSPTSAGD
jgi:NADH:ubiquinone oxidoreductase subunit 5 (subunit L)/multisubunit Na+/H+ antiporter MnhA subunit